MRIEVKIGELQQGVSVERGGQVGERDLEPVEADVERVALTPGIQPGDPEQLAEDGDEDGEQREPATMTLAVRQALLAMALHVAAACLPARARRRISGRIGRHFGRDPRAASRALDGKAITVGRVHR